MNTPKQTPGKTLAAWAARGVGFGWLASSFLVEDDATGESLGLLHVPGQTDLVLCALGAVACIVYAAIQIANGREP